MADLSANMILDVLRGLKDPEVGTSIVDLGLIYEIDTDPTGIVRIKMTTTTRFCPVSGFIVEAVKNRAAEVDGVIDVVVDLVYDPPWSPDMAALFSFEQPA